MPKNDSISKWRSARGGKFNLLIKFFNSSICAIKPLLDVCILSPVLHLSGPGEGLTPSGFSQEDPIRRVPRIS